LRPDKVVVGSARVEGQAELAEEILGRLRDGGVHL
jgi:hypothetical protein